MLRGTTTLTALVGLALSTGALAQGAAGTSGGVASERTAKAGYEPSSIVAGARLGAADVETIGGMVMTYGAFGEYAMSNNLLVGGGIDYWSRSDVGLTQEQVSLSDLALSAGAKVVFTNLTVPFRPYATAGLALHRFSANISKENEGTGPEIDRFKDVDNDVAGRGGIDLGGGVMYRVQQAVDLAGEVRYRKLFDSTVDLDQLAFTGGLTYNL